MVEKHDEVKDIYRKVALWILSATFTVFSYALWHNHSRLDDIEGVWTSDFKRRLDRAAEYPEIHETYRNLYVTQNELFHEEVRKFMAAGGRFSKGDGDALDARIRELEREVAILKDRPTFKGGKHVHTQE